ncbi:ATP-binding protein [Roseateles amylovorans]|uniref:histidine kinase n=1 Tax=Roseateles amylovorans TaxID=2978473 RepID=A0ABY6B4F5_9BURK|nr:ATP-binding protein [Roseateles amylovorans]UXH80266.1 ATP-binding protein [Roseateles amylovorans]
MRSLDWTRTAVGPPDGWPQSLKTIVRMMLDSRYAMWMAWSSELTFFCNDAYLPTLGLKRDWALGARSDQVWAEVWDAAGSRIQQVLTHGVATWDEGLQLFLERSGFPEETYHTFSYSPVHDDEMRIAGMLCVVTEVTDRVIGERRLRVLRDLALGTAGADQRDACARRACEVLADFPLDLPFTALYLTDPGGTSARRAGCAVHAAQTQLPLYLSLTDPPSGWPLQALCDSQTPQDLPSLSALSLRIPAGNWPEAVERAVLLPLKAPGHELTGFLVAGLSTRRPEDEAYHAFLNLVAGQISASLADAQAHEAERQRAEALAELDRAKTAFFSNVSHEFRTPLTLMLGPLEEIVTTAELSSPVRDQLALVMRNAGRLQRLVNSLLDFSRIEAGRAQARYQPTDLAAVTRDLASTFRSAMARADLRYEVDCAPLDRPAYVDREMWEKIVLNLLSNAFKFTLAGQVTLRLRQQPDGNTAVLEVADTGVGIPADELPRVFERFHRVAGTEGRTHEGSGIGLALVQELVRLHGGQIEVSSVRGEGTRFMVTLPLGPGHLPPAHVQAATAPTADTTGARAFVDEALRWLPESAYTGSAPSQTTHPALPGLAAGANRVDGERPATLRPHVDTGRLAAADRRFAPTYGARILLADDNADMRSYLRDLLSPYYAIDSVGDGLQALEAARRQLPDLILTDVMMPRLDGLALLAAIRADEHLRSVPVVLLSARAGEEARIEGLDAGADDYLIKPFSARELLARLGALLELRRMRRTAEAADRVRIAQFETLLNEAPMGVYLVEPSGDRLRVREANPTARQAFGSPAVQIGDDFGTLNERLWGPVVGGVILDRFRHTLATGEPYVMSEFVADRSDLGQAEAYEWQINRIPLPEGKPGVVCYFREISPHILARRQLEAADRQKDQFLAMLAHELRNPIAPIRSAGDVLSRLGLEDGRARRMVEIVRRQADNLTRLVDDLLDVSRITQGRVALQLAPVPLAEVLAQAVETVEPLMRERGHLFSVTTSGPLQVRGDLARLVQCVANVLTNAAKYTDPKGHIHLSMHAESAHAVVAVRDDGIGIPAPLQATMFDLFVQGDRTLDRSQGGLGIGLSLVKRLIEMHGGTVTAHSEGPGAGARFELRLPLLKETAPAPTPKVADETVPPQRILVVDDNADAAAALAMTLTMAGHDVAQVNSAHDALRRLSTFRPEVAVLDIGLPGMSGYELAQRIRAHPSMQAIRLIALTGYGQPEDRERAAQAGFDAHLVKPADPQALMRALRAETN